MSLPPKPLNFDQVRVLVDPRGGIYRRPEDRRPTIDPRRSLHIAWRLPSEAAAAAGSADGQSEGAADEGSSPDAVRALEPAPGRPDERESGEPSGTAAEERRADSVTGRPADFGQVGDDRVPDARVEAITRSIAEAKSLRALISWVQETCAGDERRMTGPWEFSMSLRAVGLGDSTLQLCLSREMLSLRFACDGPATQDLLSRHRASLHRQLRERLDPVLEIEIEIVTGPGEA